MQFRLLGPLEVLDGDEPIVIAAPKQRALLAMLLLHHGERVSVDRIADALWGEAAPATATKTVQVYVAQLRKALGEGLLLTEPGGYRAVVEGDDLDVVAFERLVEEGTRLLEQGDAAAARRTLEAALALWRGPALPDLPGVDEARRLEELRLLGLERRIDADLALGRHHDVLGELQELVARDPLRERVRGQLMLALYRSARQAEALDVYRDGRRRLLDELGLEPGPELHALERSILTHDAAIAAPPTRLAITSRQGAGRGRRIAAAGVAVVAAAAVAAALLSANQDGGTAAVLEGDSLTAIDVRSGDIVDSLSTGTGPTAITAGAGAVWSLNADDRTITRVDTATGERRTLGVGATPTDLAFGLGGLWVGTADTVRGAQFAGRTATAVVRLDRDTGIAADPIALPPARGVVSNATANHLAFAASSAWMINPDFSLSRIEPRRHEVAAVLTRVSAIAVAGDGRRLWVLNEDRTLARVDPRTDKVAQRIRVPASDLSAIALGAGAVWALDPAADGCGASSRPGS